MKRYPTKRYGIDRSPERGGLQTFSLEEMKSEAEWYLDIASKESIYPYNAVIIPKIQATLNFVFQLDNLCVDNVAFSSKLLNRTSPNSQVNLTNSNSQRPYIV